MFGKKFNQILQTNVELKRLRSFANDKELVVKAISILQESKDPNSFICSYSRSMSSLEVSQATGISFEKLTNID